MALLFASEWKFSLLPREIAYNKVLQEREMLKSKQKSLSSQSSARAYVRLQSKCKKLNDRVAKLSRKLLAKSKQTRARGRQYGKTYSIRYQKRVLLNQAEDCKISLSWLSFEGLVPQKVMVNDVATGGTKELILSDELSTAIQEHSQANLATERAITVDQVIYAKDRHSISDRAYIELSKIKKHLPRFVTTVKPVYSRHNKTVLIREVSLFHNRS